MCLQLFQNLQYYLPFAHISPSLPIFPLSFQTPHFLFFISTLLPCTTVPIRFAVLNLYNNFFSSAFHLPFPYISASTRIKALSILHVHSAPMSNHQFTFRSSKIPHNIYLLSSIPFLFTAFHLPFPYIPASIPSNALSIL